MSFITATDALEALDELTPATGWEVSSDALRRLADDIDAFHARNAGAAGGDEP